MAKFMIVGIDDPYGKTPLQPDILNSSGQKVWNMTGLTMIQYVRAFERKNLYEIDERRTGLGGQLKANRILLAVDTRYTPTYIICLGKMVAEAFGIMRAKPLTFVKLQRDNIWGAYLPHTSGLNRWYNKHENVRAATEFMQSVAAAATGEIIEEHIQGVLTG